MAIYPTIKTGGGNLEMAVESALGTPGTYYDFRHCEDSDPAFPTDTREILPVSSKGYWDPSTREAQLSYEKALENAGTVSTYIVGCSSAAGTPQCVKLFESMGCTIVAGSDTPQTVGAYSSTSSWEGTSGSPVAGCVHLIEGASSNANYWPYLIYTNAGAATYAIVPTMAIPSAADGDSKLVNCWTITPPKGTQVSTSKTLAFRQSSYHVTGALTGSAHVYSGCAVSEVKPITFESGAPLRMECGIHIADRSFDQTGVDLTLPTYIDSVKVPFIDGAAGFLFGYMDHATPIAYPLAATRTTGFRKAVWNPGIKTIPILETGTTTAVNGWGGYLGYYTGSTLELTMDVAKEYWTRLEATGSQTAKYVELCQRKTATNATALALFMPQCFMVGKPVVDLWGEKEMTVTVTLEPTAAALATQTAKGLQTNAPWYLGVSPAYV